MKKLISYLCVALSAMLVIVSCEKEDKRVAVTGVELDKSTLAILTRQEATLVATITPSNASNKLVLWESSDPSVATVSVTGVVEGVSEGTATITALTGDGGFSDECTVVVTFDPILVGSIELDQTEFDMEVGDDPVKITATLTSAVPDYEITDKTLTWSSSDDDIATVDQEGVVTAVAEGTAIITATANDAGKEKASATVYVSGIPLESATLSATAVVLLDGTLTLTPVYTPGNATIVSVEWESDDDDVATVNQSGVVTPVSEGTVTITVTINDDIELSCEVTVTTLAGLLEGTWVWGDGSSVYGVGGAGFSYAPGWGTTAPSAMPNDEGTQQMKFENGTYTKLDASDSVLETSTYSVDESIKLPASGSWGIAQLSIPSSNIIHGVPVYDSYSVGAGYIIHDYQILRIDANQLVLAWVAPEFVDQVPGAWDYGNIWVFKKK